MAIGCNDIENQGTSWPQIFQCLKTVMHITIYKKICNASIASGKKRITSNVLNLR
jgi:hypothetical protein